jgi:hypothetical protein
VTRSRAIALIAGFPLRIAIADLHPTPVSDRQNTAAKRAIRLVGPRVSGAHRTRSPLPIQRLCLERIASNRCWSTELIRNFPHRRILWNAHWGR